MNNKNIKKMILCLGFVITSLQMIQSQNYSSALGVTAGYSPNGSAFLFNYNYYTERDAFYQAGLFFSFQKDDVKNIEIPYNNFTLNVGWFKSLYKSPRKNLKLNLGGGILGGYEIVNNGEQILENGALVRDRSKFIYGLFASGEIDLYLDEEWSLIIKYNQFYHKNSDLGEFTLFAGAGLRFYLF